eukprot:Skav222971  [mRNA]  locus=scaffold1489:832774:845028:- [translate_table: standard]
MGLRVLLILRDGGEMCSRCFRNFRARSRTVVAATVGKVQRAPKGLGASWGVVLGEAGVLGGLLWQLAPSHSDLARLWEDWEVMAKGKTSGSRHVEPVDAEQVEEQLRTKRLAARARREERVGRWARALVEKAITAKPPTKRSRSEGPASRTRKEEAVLREELKKDEAEALGRAEKRKGDRHDQGWAPGLWAQVLPGEPGDGPIACSVDERQPQRLLEWFLLMQMECREETVESSDDEIVLAEQLVAEAGQDEVAPNGQLVAMAAVQGFEHRKQTFLAKCDKSSAGEIDEKAREICAELNARPAFFTTSSCSGRAFIWRGDGVKSTECFSRWRVAHDLVDAGYFDLTTLDGAGNGPGNGVGNGAGNGGAPRWRWLRQLATVSSWCRGGAWQGRKHQRQERAELAEKLLESLLVTNMGELMVESDDIHYIPLPMRVDGIRKILGDYRRLSVDISDAAATWLRFEPFILHVCCRDLVAAAALMAAARSVFKNVGLQGFDTSKLIVAIWGDEGLDMPLTSPEGVPLFGDHLWLQSLVNSRHQRNWAKIDRFTAAIRQMEEPVPSGEPNGEAEDKELRHFDVVGDIAIVNVKPKEELSLVGNAILKQDALEGGVDRKWIR